MRLAAKTGRRLNELKNQPRGTFLRGHLCFQNFFAII